MKRPFQSRAWRLSHSIPIFHSDVMAWGLFPHYWPFCAGKPPVTGQFAYIVPAIRSSEVRLMLVSSEKLLNKHASCMWVETPWLSYIWRHSTQWYFRCCNASMLPVLATILQYRWECKCSLHQNNTLEYLILSHLISFYLISWASPLTVPSHYQHQRWLIICDRGDRELDQHLLR